MSSYSYFAKFYDDLTYNVDYSKRALYLLDIFKMLNHNPGLTLDLACGTGSLTIELKKLGLDIYGVDKSQNMLCEAQNKAFSENLNILFLCQDATKLDLYGTVNTVISSLDSLNHITKKSDLQLCFDKVSLFLEKDGYFIFDMNTPYKHKHILGNNTFVYDMPSVYCVWQNSYLEKDNIVNIELDFFEKHNNTYTRYEESFSERAYSYEEIAELADNCGLKLCYCFSDMTMNPIGKTDQRALYILKKL